MAKNRINKRVIAALLALIPAFEGVRYTAYRDQGNVPTICSGITTGVKMGDKATPEQCEAKLTTELMKHAKPLEEIPYQLLDRVNIAFADFTYNIGVTAFRESTAFRLLKARKVEQACDQILRWRYTRVNGVKKDCSIASNRCGGIWVRRTIERDLCVGDITVNGALIKLGKLPLGPDYAVN